MNDDRLDRAVAALRDEGDRPASQARLTRERILRDLRPTKSRRRATWLIPLAALLAGSTVLAATGRLPDALHAAARAFGFEERASVPAPAAPRGGAPVSSAEAPAKEIAASDEHEPAFEPPPEAAQPSPARTVVVARARIDGGVPRATQSPSAPAAPSATVPVSPEPSPVAAASASVASSSSPSRDDQAALALYRRAHQLQFVDQNPSAAVAAWDAYLAAEPKGPLSVDARYDRALCLVRAGRKNEARTALVPFAAGSFGGYRQKEARALLDALSSSP